MTRCQCASCLVKALCEYGLEPSSLPAIPGNSHGLPRGQPLELRQLRVKRLFLSLLRGEVERSVAVAGRDRQQVG